ncbi:MAG: hypothetical protein U9R08_05055 [Nanoarchaeota archaeon]|nr:hypothetical protein [Nanoarchaeota archaeon]
MGEILVIDDVQVIRKAIKAVIKRAKPKFNVFTYENMTRFLSDQESITEFLSINKTMEDILAEEPRMSRRSLLARLDVAILDMSLDYKKGDVDIREDGLKYLKTFMRFNIPVIVYTGSEKLAQEAFENGAFYSFQKSGLNNDAPKLINALDQCISIKKEVACLKPENIPTFLQSCFEEYQRAPTEPKRLYFLTTLYLAASTDSGMSSQVFKDGSSELEAYLQAYSKINKD